MKRLSIAGRTTKTRRQIAQVDTALVKEFSDVEPAVVHREVAAVSEELLANADFTDHVAVLTGRILHERLEAASAPVAHESHRSTEDSRQITKSHWWIPRRAADRPS